MEEQSGGGASVMEVRFPAAAPMRLLEWRVKAGALLNTDSVLALFGAENQDEAERTPERRVRCDRAGVLIELCYQPGQRVTPGAVIARMAACSHPIVMKGLCAECGQDLTQLQSRNGKQQALISTATVSMVHSVPELMVSSEQAEELGREDQKRLQRSKKLVLMVDLDQTLIHTTEQHCHQVSKGIFHFQLGRGEPMLHTRLRPYCKEFLEKISKMYELHVFTFGSRLYAHTIAGFLDPEKKLFSHRILSRDECIDPFSKTGNLRNLFPCGDSMVCIIDDREDVWKFAPNLITVKKYIYFKGTGDINAPPASSEAQLPKKPSGDQTESSGPEEQNNGLEKHEKEPKSQPKKTSTDTEEVATHEEAHPKGEEPEKSSSEKSKQEEPEREETLSSPQNKEEKPSESPELEPDLKPSKEPPENTSDTEEMLVDSEKESIAELGNGCADKKEPESGSQNSEPSEVTIGEESLEHSGMEEEEEEEDKDQDDHLIYLEEVLIRVHTEYYSRYEAYLQGQRSEMPDIRRIVPELKSRSLSGTTIVFSGLYPTNYPMERTRESYHAKALGAKIGKSLVLDDKDPERTTHLIAARAGTEKVRQALACEHLHVVNPDWLWGCLERWEHVEEQLFPLKEDQSQRTNSPTAFPDFLDPAPAPVLQPMPLQRRVHPPPEVRTYDPVTGKLIRKCPPVSRQSSYLQPQRSSGQEGPARDLASQQQMDDLSGAGSEAERPGASRRQRQPSMSESLPLYTLCKEDLDSMDREVDDILGEESDNDSEEKSQEVRMGGGGGGGDGGQTAVPTPPQHTLSITPRTPAPPGEGTALTEASMRGHKRKRQDAKDEDKDVDSASQSSKDSNEDEEGSNSEADEMAAALDAELNSFL